MYKKPTGRLAFQSDLFTGEDISYQWRVCLLQKLVADVRRFIICGRVFHQLMLQLMHGAC